MKLLSSILIAILLFSCNMPDCKSSNPVFDTAAINSKAYNMELVSQLQNIDEDNLRYWIIDYTTDSTGEYLITAVQDDDSLCGRFWLDITQSTDVKLDRVKDREGKGYSDAELSGLKYEIIHTANGNYQFIYTSLARIID